MTDQSTSQDDLLLSELDLLHSLSDIYYNLKGRKNRTSEHDETLNNLEQHIHTLTNSILKGINNG